MEESISHDQCPLIVYKCKLKEFKYFLINYLDYKAAENDRHKNILCEFQAILIFNQNI